MCSYEPWLVGAPGSTFPLMQRGSSGAHVEYLQKIITCHQGYFLGWENDSGFYWSLTEYHVAQFQAWWNGYGAGLVVDGKAGPQTMPYYRLMVGHTPW